MRQHDTSKLGRAKGRVALACILVAAVGGTATADAATPKFKNCTAMHKRYKHGVAKNRSAAQHANGLKGAPKVSRVIYVANKRLDRDHDGVACEA